MSMEQPKEPPDQKSPPQRKQRKRGQLLTFLILLLLLWDGRAAGQTPPSPGRTANYTMPADVVTTGGGEKAKSNNYMLDDTIGEANIGLSKTANYSLNAGYRQMASATPYLSLSCSAAVTLPSIAPGSQTTGSGTCIVTTDADAGYNLQWSAQSAGWLTGWSYRKQITISKTNVDSALTDFPFLVKITNDTNIGPNSRSDGYDIRFTSATGALLKYERESYSYGTGSGSGNFWVKVPVVNSVADTTIYVYYGNSSATDGQNVTAVWDNNFKAVWHMSGSTLHTTDSTSNGNNGTNYGAAATSGKGDGAGSFTAASANHIDVANKDSLNNLSNMTVSLWFNTDSYRSEVLIGKDVNSGWYWQYYSGVLGFWVNGAKKADVGTPSTGVWHHLTLVYDGTNMIPYLDDVVKTQGSFSGNVPSSTGILGIGWDGINQGAGNIYMFNGSIDEVHISSVARSAAWIKFEYNNMNSVGNEATWSAQQTQGNDSASLVSENGDSIVPYTPSVSGTPEAWSVAVADSEWGGRLRADSTDADTKWGTEGGSSKWLNIPTTNYTVVTRASRTAIGGSTELLQYRVEIGSSHLQPTGKYSATVTLTAVSL